MSVLVEVVVGQLQLVESDRLLQPVGSGSRAVRVNVQPSRHMWLCLARDHPFWVVVLVATVVQRYNIDQKNVLGVWVQTLQADFEGWKHSSEMKKDIFIHGTSWETVFQCPIAYFSHSIGQILTMDWLFIYLHTSVLNSLEAQINK